MEKIKIINRNSILNRKWFGMLFLVDILKEPIRARKPPKKEELLNKTRALIEQLNIMIKKTFG
jgi:hypothetical protein